MYWLAFVLTFGVVLLAGIMSFFYDKQIVKKIAAHEEHIAELYRVVNKIIAKRGIINIESEEISDIQLYRNFRKNIWDFTIKHFTHPWFSSF